MTPLLRRTALAGAVLATVLLASAFALGDRPAPTAPDTTATAAPTTRQVVLALLAPERIAVLDLDTGAVVQQRLPGGTLCRSPLLVVDGRIVFVAPGRHGGRVMAVDASLRRRPHQLATADVVVPSATPGRVWLGARAPGSHGDWLVRELTIADAVSTRPPRTAPPLPILGVVSDGLVLGGHRSVLVWDPRTGRRSRATPGPYLLAVRGEQVASCGGRCSSALIADGARGRVVHAPHGARFVPSPGAFSADGARLAVALKPRAARVPGSSTS
ncbi:MAG TPA: hypothetical protein VK506_03935 [Conexibacter sp.]|nr:hypothetical protein [Conexibacter sp.]